MIEGGIYDQLGGGFATIFYRYEWLAPHFEKMLYDNALLVISIERSIPADKKRTVQRSN